MDGSRSVHVIALLSLLFLPLLLANARLDPLLWLPSEDFGRRRSGGEDDSVGTRWALLIAGSMGFNNYRHQADVCHAYQVMKNGGLKDKNIIVFMYDDIAYDGENPRPGVIINHPQGGDVYAGVPKDYVGKEVNVDNFIAVLLGNKTAVTGGSRKVVDSGPDDHIFIFYSDHGAAGVLSMPNSPSLFADDFVSTLKKKHDSKSYKRMVIYLEACESGSIFEGLLPEDIGIYATTASNAYEDSWATYCPDQSLSLPPEYMTCLGDLYSISWLEDSDIHNLRSESLKQQYQLVKNRTSVNGTYDQGSHVMQYGQLDLNEEHIFWHIGSKLAKENSTFIEDSSLLASTMMNQHDADLVYYWNKFRNSPIGSSKKLDAQKELLDIMTHRLHIDNSIALIGKLLFGSNKGTEILNAIRPKGKALVDDWTCLKSMVHTFEMHCGSLSQYGMKHMRSLANICNAGITKETMAKVSAEVCFKVPSTPWSSLHKGFSA